VQQRAAVVWNPTSKLPAAAFKKVHVQKQHAEQQQQPPPPVLAAAAAMVPTQVTAPLQAQSPQQQQQNQNSPSSTRYQTRQAAKGTCGGDFVPES